MLAVNHYDRHVALVDGTVQPDGIALQTLIVGQSVGVAANRANLEQFVQYSFEQGLISRSLRVEELFHASTLAT